MLCMGVTAAHGEWVRRQPDVGVWSGLRLLWAVVVRGNEDQELAGPMPGPSDWPGMLLSSCVTAGLGQLLEEEVG